MNDRRALRRYLALVHHAEELLEAAFDGPAVPAPAEAMAELEGLVATLSPVVARIHDHVPEPVEVRRLLAGWVH